MFGVVEVRGIVRSGAASELGPFILRQRTWGDRIGESVSCQQPTHALQQTAELFDHLVGAGQEHCGYLKAKALRGLMTNSNLINWTIGRSAGLAPLRICPA
jgi:hypothetical protein